MPIYASQNEAADITIPNNTLLGSGSLTDPYRISNCLDLASLNHPRYQSGANESKSFILTNDIDCSDTINWNDGVGFIPLDNKILMTYYESGPLPEQYFDGNNHTITGLHTTLSSNGDNAFGLFDFIGPGATLKNLHIENAIFENTGGTNQSINSIAVGTNFGKIENVSVQGTVNGVGSAGLLVGKNFGSIDRASAKGSITIDGGGQLNGVSIGGLIAQNEGLGGVDGLETKIENSFADVDITSSGTSMNLTCGGFIGSGSDPGSGNTHYPVYISNTYASGNVNCLSSSSSNATGLIGSINAANYTVTNSFAVGQVGGNSGYTSGFLQFGWPVTLTNNYFDLFKTNQINCTPLDPNACTGVNLNNSEPNYFENNNANAPLDQFDFTSIWKKQVHTQNLEQKF